MKKFLICVFCLCVLTSCVTNHGNFTVLTDKILDTSHFKVPYKTVGSPVVGSSVSHIIVGFETNGDVLSEAIDDSMNQHIGSDMLVNVNVRHFFWIIPSIYGQKGWSVRGSANSSKMPVKP